MYVYECVYFWCAVDGNRKLNIFAVKCKSICNFCLPKMKIKNVWSVGWKKPTKTTTKVKKFCVKIAIDPHIQCISNVFLCKLVSVVFKKTIAKEKYDMTKNEINMDCERNVDFVQTNKKWRERRKKWKSALNLLCKVDTAVRRMMREYVYINIFFLFLST